MGALTKLSEFACCGIPVLTSQHACFSQEVPPGVRGLPSVWEAWYGCLERWQDLCGASEQGYQDWESRQPESLSREISRFLN